MGTLFNRLPLFAALILAANFLITNAHAAKSKCSSVFGGGPVSKFMQEHFLHYSAGEVVRAADGYKKFVEGGGKMMMTLAGAMSTAELGKSLAEMIRQDKIHMISTTGANLEEGIFLSVAKDHYEHIPEFRSLGAKGEKALLERGINRVTDHGIPEEQAMRAVEDLIIKEWQKAESEQVTEAKAATKEKREINKDVGRYYPHEFLYKLLETPGFLEKFQDAPEHNWLLAAKEKGVFIVTPGWEDSTLGNMFVAAVQRGELKNIHTVRDGKEAMLDLANWYQTTSVKNDIGFFQIGGGIAGDFPICAVPMLRQDLMIDVPLLKYFAQIRNSPERHGSYSGAHPHEKITWGKLSETTEIYDIEMNDATIVAPLVFARVLGW